MMYWYLKPWKQFADFKGRARRKEYWTFTLVNIAISMALSGGAIFSIFSGDYAGAMDSSGGVVGSIGTLFSLALFVPTLAVLVRRLHDTGRSGLWFFILLIPVIGSVWLIVLSLLEGDHGSNKYGPKPE